MLVAVLLSGAAALAGCGFGSSQSTAGSPYTAREYRAHANRLCSAAARELVAFDAPAAYDGVRPYLERAARGMRRPIARLAALRPPDSLAEVAGEGIESLRSEVFLIGRMAHAIGRTHDPGRGARAVIPELRRVRRLNRSRWSRVGAQHCARPLQAAVARVVANTRNAPLPADRERYLAAANALCARYNAAARSLTRSGSPGTGPDGRARLRAVVRNGQDLLGELRRLHPPGRDRARLRALLADTERWVRRAKRSFEALLSSDPAVRAQGVTGALDVVAEASALRRRFAIYGLRACAK